MQDHENPEKGYQTNPSPERCQSHQTDSFMDEYKTVTARYRWVFPGKEGMDTYACTGLSNQPEILQGKEWTLGWLEHEVGGREW